MKLILTILAVALAGCSSFAEKIDGGNTRAAAGTAIPKTLDEALLALDKMLGERIKSEFRSGKQRAVDLHFSLGAGLRNMWGLSNGSDLAKRFNELGIMDPDAMSAIILETYIRKTKNKPLGVEELIRRFRADWDSDARRKIRERQAEYEKKNGA